MLARPSCRPIFKHFVTSDHHFQSNSRHEGQPKNQHQLSAPTPAAPGQPRSDPWTTQRSRQLPATLDFQGSTLCKNCLIHWHWHLDIYTVNIWTLGKISISFQLPPPGSSTKSASASSLHHQAAAPHQPAYSKASSQPAVNSTTLPHPHHGSQVCCHLDILWLYSSIVFLVWAICTGIK